MKNLVLSSLMHCPIVADVMSEIAADYFPGVRMVDASTISVDVATFDALDVPTYVKENPNWVADELARLERGSAATRRAERLQSGKAYDATVDGEVLVSVTVAE